MDAESEVKKLMATTGMSKAEAMAIVAKKTAETADSDPPQDDTED